MKNDTVASRKCSICPGPHEMKVNFLRCNYQPCKVGNKYCGSSIQIRTCEVNGKGFAVLDRKDGHFRRDNEEFITTKRHLFSNEETEFIENNLLKTPAEIRDIFPSNPPPLRSIQNKVKHLKRIKGLVQTNSLDAIQTKLLETTVDLGDIASFDEVPEGKNICFATNIVAPATSAPRTIEEFGRLLQVLFYNKLPFLILLSAYNNTP